MQISIETTTQSTSLYSASISSSDTEREHRGPKGHGHAHGHGHGRGHEIGRGNGHHKDAQGSPAVSLLEAASDKAEKDAVVIAALQDAVAKGKGEDGDDDKPGALATVEDYQKAASQLKAALGEDDDTGSAASISYESATISTTTIEAEIGGETLTAQFVSFERVSYDNDTGLSVSTASASDIEGTFGNGSFSYESSSVSELYVGTGEQVSSLLGLTA
ncbi:hypothetical protein [Roseibium aggregatum]|uniref:Uncharacterized protein n=1 Tax=Roseibium aggregatum TaxID=187304 RepID=A0A939IYB7_9HYPH|nr:hypothetical protein [Roseibium aggregatum]MBN9668801.1 hypothetical protein [Roseibium aggregatum]